jgi:DedD protein
MATEQTNTGEARSELSDLKRKLAWRMGFAGLMIVALLGGLALFDRLSVTRNEVVEPAPPQFTEPVPVPKKAQTQPVTPAAPEPETSAAPVDKSAPLAEPPPRPEVAAQPTLPRPAASAARPAAPGAPAKPAASSAPAAPAKPAASGAPAAAAAPAASAASAAPALPSPSAPPAPPRLIYGYALQAGVFSDPRRAEELHAKLTLEGIPSTIEARVEVGPFKTRQEAEAARAKLKTLGIDAVLQPPKGGKRP